MTKTIIIFFSSTIPNGIGTSTIISPLSTQYTTITPSIQSLRGSIIQRLNGKLNCPPRFKWGSTISMFNTTKKAAITILKLPKSSSQNLSLTSIASIIVSPLDPLFITHLISLWLKMSFNQENKKQIIKMEQNSF